MQATLSSLLCQLCRGGLIVYSIELSNQTLSSGDGSYTLDLGAPPHDFAQASTTCWQR
jgi:hypothetical protein